MRVNLVDPAAKLADGMTPGKEANYLAPGERSVPHWLRSTPIATSVAGAPHHRSPVAGRRHSLWRITASPREISDIV
jgi:hypothetical protein